MFLKYPPGIRSLDSVRTVEKKHTLRIWPSNFASPFWVSCLLAVEALIGGMNKGQAPSICGNFDVENKICEDMGKLTFFHVFTIVSIIYFFCGIFQHVHTPIGLLLLSPLFECSTFTLWYCNLT